MKTKSMHPLFVRALAATVIHGLYGLCAVCALSTLSLLPALAAADLDDFLGKLSSPDEGVRRAAWEGAAGQGVEALGPLAALFAGENRDAALAARRAMDRIAHAAAAPGSATRGQATQALAAVAADPKMPLGVKEHVFDLLGSVGDDGAAPALQKALADTQVRDFARKALRRIPGDAAAKALLAGMDSASGEWLDALILTLGEKRAACAAPRLIAIAQAGGAGKVAAAAALARIGDPSAIPAIQSVLRSCAGRDLSLLTDDYLKLGDTLRASGSAEAAGKIYREVLATAKDDAARATALHALSGSAASADLSIILEAAGDPSAKMRALALELLEKSKSPDVDKALFERMAGAQGGRKASLLRVLSARKAPGVEKSVQEALASDDIDLKITALELAGKIADPSNEAALLSAMEKGSEPVKAVATTAYLNLADSRVSSDPKAAESMFLKAYAAAQDPRQKGRALVGLAQFGSAESLARIEEARKAPELAQSAIQAQVLYARALGKAGKKAEAVEMLTSVLSSGASREVIQSAFSGLKEFGGDPTALQKKQGLLASWWLMGPFANNFDAEYSPEKGINLVEQIDERGRKRKWQEFHSTSMDGKVDLRLAFQRSSEVSAYAYAEVVAPRAMDVRLKMGSDDGVKCWINGKVVHSNNVVRAFTMDEDVVDTKLEAGLNKILLKVTQGGGEWEFAFRITDREDKPLDLTAFRAPAQAK